MDDYGPKAEAVTRLRLNAARLDDYARNGEPQRLGLGLYRGERLRAPLLDAIRSYVPPPPPEVKPQAPVPKIVRLDSMVEATNQGIILDDAREAWVMQKWLGAAETA